MKNGLFWSVRGRLELIFCRNTYFFTRISILIAPEALDSLKMSFLMIFIIGFLDLFVLVLIILFKSALNKGFKKDPKGSVL